MQSRYVYNTNNHTAPMDSFNFMPPNESKPTSAGGSLNNLIQNFLVFPDQFRSREGNGPIPRAAPAPSNGPLPNPILSQCGSIQQVSSVASLVNPIASESKRENLLPSGFVLAPLRTSSPPSDVQSTPRSPQRYTQDLPHVPAPSSTVPSREAREEREKTSFYSGSDSESIDGTSEDETEGKLTLNDDKSFINVVWIRHYEELKRFKEIHHHTNVTRTRKESRKLGNWVAEQRRKKKQGRLNKNQILLLNACGFEWEKRKKRTTYSSIPNGRSSPSTSEHYEATKASNDEVNALLSLGKW